MKTVTFSNRDYQQTESGTCYYSETSSEMINLLERLRDYGSRVRFHWGDTKTGLDWGDEYMVWGRIGRSCGDCKIPLLVHNSRSLGGPAISTDSIVKISAKGGRTIYQHPKYHKETA